MTSAPKNGDHPQFDLLLMTVTESEQEQLLATANELGIAYTPLPGQFDRELYDFGRLGDYRVAAIRSRMGALDHGGSASAALVYRELTRATGIIAVGMAFGLSDRLQAIGHVLVSEGLFPYDDRDVEPSKGGGFEYRYAEIDPLTGTIRGPDGKKGRERAKFRRAKPSLLRFFERHKSARPELTVHIGALLSGGARIHCAAYRDMIYGHFEARGRHIIGGEMEAVGLLSASDPKEPWWIVVKGISDFADENRDSIIDASRTSACRNAARFVLTSLCQATATDKL